MKLSYYQNLMKEALIAYDEGGGMKCDAHGRKSIPTFRNAPILQVVYQKLEDETYAHYVDWVNEMERMLDDEFLMRME